MNSKKYFKIYPILNQNCFINIIVGGKGCGKTFNIKHFTLNQLKRGNEVLFFRRTSEECKLFYNNFFSDIKTKIEFKKGKLNKYTYYIQIGDNCIYFGSVSTFFKNNGINFSKVKYIFFDEFDPIDNRYINKNEPSLFFSTCATIFRERTDCKIFLIGNRCNPLSKYLQYLNVKIENGLKVVNNIAIQSVKNNYHINNNFANTFSGCSLLSFLENKSELNANTEKELLKLPKFKKYLFTLNINDNYFLFFLRHKKIFYQVAKKPPTNNYIYNVSYETIRTKYDLLIYDYNNIINFLYNNFRQNNIYHYKTDVDKEIIKNLYNNTIK